MTNELRILFQDDHYVAIHKPAGMLVHKSKMARDAKVFALQELRNQLNRQVYPCHRLDRKTSGVLLFALSEEALSKMRELWMNNQVKKEYLAIVRGHIPDEGEIDYPLVNEKEVEQEAFTRYSCLKRSEIPYSSGKFPTSRYSLVKLYPETGRYHQLRKHLAHIFYPIIGDRPHGCNKQNKFFKEQFEMMEMMLHASKLSFIHPYSGFETNIEGEVVGEFGRMMEELFTERVWQGV